MKASDVYDLLVEKRKIKLPCSSQAEFFTIRSMLYRARKAMSDALTLLDGVEAANDGCQMNFDYDKAAQVLTVTLTPKVPKREWTIIEDEDDSRG